MGPISIPYLGDIFSEEQQVIRVYVGFMEGYTKPLFKQFEFGQVESGSISFAGYLTTIKYFDRLDEYIDKTSNALYDGTCAL